MAPHQEAPTIERPATQEVVIRVDRAKPRNSLFYKGLAAVGAGVLALGSWAAIDNLDPTNLFPGFPDLSGIGINIDNHPPDAAAGVLRHTIQLEEKMNANCRARMSVAAEINGNKDEFLGGGEFSKILYGDFLPCGDNVPVNINKTLNPVTGKVTGILATTNGLMVTQPRIDELDYRNCAPLRPGDSQKEMNKKIKQWMRDRRAGENPECDDGFDFSGMVARGGDISKVITTGRAAAQMAMAVLNPPQDKLKDMNKDFKADLKEELEARFPDAKVIVQSTPDEVRIKAQTKKVLEDLKANTYEVKFEDEDGKSIMHVSAPGGGEVSVRIQSVVADSINIDAIMSEVPIPKNTSPGK